VTVAQIVAAIQDDCGDPNAVKALTRAGMGVCQGRSCEPQIAALVRARTPPGARTVARFTVRPPLRPVPLGAIAERTEVA
jgi:hypothetical protein